MDFQEKLTSGYYSAAGGFPYVSAYEAKKDPQKAYQRKVYLETEERLFQEFKKDAFEELGISGNPKAEKLFQLAYSEGHSSGYSGMFSQMETWVDLIT